jgi:hypothetical protein
MPERWRRALDALGRSEADTHDLRERVLRGRRLPDPPRRRGSAVLAGTLSLALAATSFGVLRDAFREGPGPLRSGTPSPSLEGALEPDPAEICDVPAYDPSVAILGDDSAGVFGTTGPSVFPLQVLDAPGQAASAIGGPAAAALRSFLDDPQAVHAPSDGWRPIAASPDEVIFAAPTESGYSDWWMTRFTRTDETWAARESELVDQHRTPAQLGRGLRLSWTDDVIFDRGEWASTLSLTNQREDAWTAGEDGLEPRGLVHVFDPASGTEVGHVAETSGRWGPSPELAPGASMGLPVSLGGALADLDPHHTYDAIACVPELGLASPVGTVRVEENTVVRSVRVLTYPYHGVGMLALGGGRLMIHNGCLAVADRSPRPIYVLWPDGYSMVYRQHDAPVLIDAIGREVARLGDEVTLGGGNVPTEHADGVTIGGLPEDCRASGEGFFQTSGLADG